MAVISGRVMAAIDSALEALSRRHNSKSSTVETPPKSQTDTHDCICSHRMTIHYYGGHGVTEHCLVSGCPCNLFEIANE